MLAFYANLKFVHTCIRLPSDVCCGHKCSGVNQIAQQFELAD